MRYVCQSSRQKNNNCYVLECTPGTSYERTLQRERHSYKASTNMTSPNHTIVQNVTTRPSTKSRNLKATKKFKEEMTELMTVYNDSSQYLYHNFSHFNYASHKHSLKSLSYDVRNNVYKPSPTILAVIFNGLPRVFNLLKKRHSNVRSITYWLVSVFLYFVTLLV